MVKLQLNETRSVTIMMLRPTSGADDPAVDVNPMLLSLTQRGMFYLFIIETLRYHFIVRSKNE